ncbi:MAG: HDOD domain-containing protein [Deltaproteobacteria bacterium]|nr:HDOD domain-containing protein [Deltaproteobacteria bacterium]
METEKKYIKDVDRLVPRPDIALEVMKMAHDNQCSIPEMAQKIQMDPSLTANMLRLANSAYFGHMREITSIKDIIIRFGLETVKIIAITGASVGLMKSPQQAYNLEPGSLWHHSHATAVLSSVIAKYAVIEDSASIYTASLLHDIGKVILNRPLQIAISNNRNLGKKFKTLIELEQALLETDHAKVGMALLQKWGLPDNVTIPVGFHHRQNCPEAEQMDVKIVSLANFLVESIGIRSMLPENFTFNVNEFIDQNQELPEIPNFQANMERIIDEFFYQFNEMSKLS